MAKQEPIEIPVKLSIGEIRKQLKQIQGEIANTFDPEEIARLSERAGELKDNLVRVNEQVGIYASGSPFEQSANALGLVGSQLASLDFEGAAESAQLLQAKINSITPEQVNKQMQGLTDTFSTLGKVSGSAIMGVIKNVGMLAKAFMSFGLSLLANPIFLIAAAIVAIVVAIVALLNKLGLLKPILDAIGKVFEWIGWVIDQVVKGFNMLTDWLGFTDIAAEESAKRQTAAAEKVADSYDKRAKRVTAALDEEIKINQINGKSTFDLEVKKQEVIRQGAQYRIKALEAKIKEAKLTGELDAEEIKALREKIAAQRELYTQSLSDTRVLRAQENADRKKAFEEQKKEEAANAKEAAANAKKYAADRLAAQRQVIDLELANLEDGVEKELKLNAEKYRRLIEDTAKNESLTASEKNRIKKLLAEQSKIEEDKIKTDEEKRRKEEAEAEIAEINKALEEANAARAEAAKRESMAAAELRAKKNADDLSAQIALLEAKKNAELANTQLTESEKALIEEQFRQDKIKLEQEAADKQAAIKKAQVDAEKQLLQSSLNAAQGVADLVFQIKKDRAEKGSAAEEKAARQQFKVNKALQLVSATMSAIQGVQSALAQPTLVPDPIGSILKFANAAAVGVAGAANVAKIAAAKFEGVGGGAAASPQSGGGANATASAAPSFNLFGSANQFNNTSQGQAVEKPANQQITVKAVVAADEVTAEQEVANSILAGSKL